MFHFHPHFHPNLFLRSLICFVVVAAIALRCHAAALLRRLRFVFAVLLWCVRTVAVVSDNFLAMADILLF
jgi:hypothetical protein